MGNGQISLPPTLRRGKKREKKDATIGTESFLWNVGMREGGGLLVMRAWLENKGEKVGGPHAPARDHANKGKETGRPWVKRELTVKRNTNGAGSPNSSRPKRRRKKKDDKEGPGVWVT